MRDLWIGRANQDIPCLHPEEFFVSKYVQRFLKPFEVQRSIRNLRHIHSPLHSASWVSSYDCRSQSSVGHQLRTWEKRGIRDLAALSTRKLVPAEIRLLKHKAVIARNLPAASICSLGGTRTPFCALLNAAFSNACFKANTIYVVIKVQPGNRSRFSIAESCVDVGK